MSLPQSNGTIERAHVDLMHFTFQAAFLTAVPSIYHPHDLQHIHLPEYFSEYERHGRTLIYKRFCDQARMVAVSSSWVRQDLEANLGVAREKITVVPLAPPIESIEVSEPAVADLIRRRFDLPDNFAFYPAQTWPHKNHLGLIEAAAIIRERYGLLVPLVFSGRKGDFYPQLAKRIAELKMDDQVKFLGFVTQNDLRSLYRLCRCVIIPTKFEAASFPLWEAFLAMAPAGCSNVTSLPRQAGDAALLFDPNSVDQIASCLHKLWTDANLRAELSKRGWENVQRFTWQRTALVFRAHYRRILGLKLTQQDTDILRADSLM
ncbi:MAG: glycosyltransferase family 4 protein [Pseudomonadota bacterium]